MEINLLEKTELWIDDLTLVGADLTRIAEVVAEVLGLERQSVLVVDVRENHITLDILQKSVEAEQIYGKKRELLARLSAIPGVKVDEGTDIHSDGILGMIGIDEADAKKVLEQSGAMVAEMTSRVARRVCVFSTGFEVKRGMIKDSNAAYLKTALEECGFEVSFGGTIDDDKDLIAGRIYGAIEEGFGLIITTGGVGAESKDRTVEAVLAIDPEAETPYIIHFTKGTGRHEKDGVRIAVGRVGWATVIALPGPNDEVKVSVPALVSGIREQLRKAELAAVLADVLRMNLRRKHGNEAEPDGHARAHEHR